MQKDFSHTLNIDELKQTEQKYTIKADSNQLKFIKELLKVEDAKLFEAHIFLKLNRKLHRLDIKGEVKADLILKSVVSLENFEKSYQVSFSHWYDTELTYQDLQDMDIPVFDDAPDIIENGQIDLVQICLEELSLALDDYPKQEGETFYFKSEFDEQTTKASHPFAALQKLKK